jgi:ATP-dependent helicase/nuclease subunit A
VQAEEAVRLMSIHQSKGLEFPVVAVADLGKPWNLGDLNADIILDEEYGLCLVVRPPLRRRSYPSLPHWLAARRQRRELLGEELRLLYVAMTRACDKLLLAGTTSRRAAEEKWPRVSADHLTAGQVSQARHALDWLGPLISQVTGCADWLAQPAGQSPLLSWRVHEGAIQEPPAPVEQTSCAGEAEVASDALEDLKRRLAWEYPHPAATREPAKTSVTGLRRRVLEETDEESRWAFGARSFGRSTGGAAATPEAPRRLSASEVGTAYHRFLQFVSLDRACGGAELAGEAEQLCRQGFLTPEEAAAVDVTAVAAFWNSPLGQRILGRAEWVRRELPFTARFAPEDLQELALTGTAGLAADEFVIVQGVADLVVIQPEEIWLVDFKSDQVGEGELGDRCRSYAPQLSLYALALQRIYQRPVTEAWLHFLALRRSVPVELVRC